VDARAVDAEPPVDGRPSCHNGPGEECPGSLPFCCVYTLEGPYLCFAEPNDGCNESPPPGTAATCALTTPTGCPVERPWCCAEQYGTGTWCVDHELLGEYVCAQGD
jgi:hypothetical protein